MSDLNMEPAVFQASLALRMVALNMPWLSGLVYAVSVSVDDRFPVAAVTKTGRVLVNPVVFSEITLRDATFVIAHELMHLALDTFGRESDFDSRETVNYAHDYIINDLLSHELKMAPPLGGLHFQGAADWSLEQLVAWMSDRKRKARRSWSPGVRQTTRTDKKNRQSAGDGTLSGALQAAGVIPSVKPTVAPSGLQDTSRENRQRICGDVIFPSQEAELFPVTSTGAAIGAGNIVTSDLGEIARKCMQLKEAERIYNSVNNLVIAGQETGEYWSQINALRMQYHPPWQAALQRWLQAATPGQKTYSRASRRGADRIDCVLPGRNRDGWTLHIVLDTSGSMSNELGVALGAIADFCESVGVTDVHILQCDCCVTTDDWVHVEDLQNYKIAGFGGSDMSPAMLRLADDPAVLAVVVITDGEIAYPEVEPPYMVMWAITSSGSFKHPYGDIVRLNHK